MFALAELKELQARPEVTHIMHCIALPARQALAVVLVYAQKAAILQLYSLLISIMLPMPRTC